MIEENTILKKGLLSITWPILVENFFRMTSIFISYWIFSLISDATAAVMSVINLKNIITSLKGYMTNNDHSLFKIIKMS